MNIDIESWQAIAGAGALVVVGVHNKWEARRTRKTAEKAVELSEPTGNGFAKGVKDALACLQESAADQKVATERIEARQQQDAGLLYSHIQAHANADVLKGARSEPPGYTP